MITLEFKYRKFLYGAQTVAHELASFMQTLFGQAQNLFVRLAFAAMAVGTIYGLFVAEYWGSDLEGDIICAALSTGMALGAISLFFMAHKSYQSKSILGKFATLTLCSALYVIGYLMYHFANIIAAGG